MFCVKICLTRKKHVKEIDSLLVDLLDGYANCLYCNGQILGGWDIYSDESKEHIWIDVVTPEMTSLNEEYNSEYVNRDLKRIKENFEFSELQLKGESLEYLETCFCKESSFYYIEPDDITPNSPLVCGDCNKPVILYKLENNNLVDHCDLIHYSNTYNRMVGLFMYGLDDRYSYKQITNPKSKLAKEGIRISRIYQKETQKPVLLHLHYFNGLPWPDIFDKSKLQQFTPPVCPVCGFEWSEGIKNNQPFYMCNKDNIIADNPNYEVEELES